MSNFPILESSRLILDELQPADSLSLLDILSNSEVKQHYDLQSVVDIDSAEQVLKAFRARYEKGFGVRWAIREPSSEILLGTCGFNVWVQENASSAMGFELHPDYWRRGLMTEAINLMLDYGFSGHAPVKMHRITAMTKPENIGAVRALEKSGFTCEGTLRDGGYWGQRFHDLLLYAKLSTD